MITRVLLAAVLLLNGCSTVDDKAAFYQSAMTQAAWFAIQAEPAPDAWVEFEAALLSVPAELRSGVRKTAIEEARRAAQN